MYCVTHEYILVLNGTSNGSSWQHNVSIQTPTIDTNDVSISIDDLSDNAMLTFKVLVLNEDDNVQSATTGMDICKFTLSKPYKELLYCTYKESGLTVW